MQRILLIHWNEAETDDRVQRLGKAGFSIVVLNSVSNGPADLRRVLEKPVDAIVIDLTRRPSLGRDVGLSLRSRKATRYTPLVFVDGEPDKVSRVKSVLPDAVFTQWASIRIAINRAIKNRPADPVVQNVMAGYSGTPLPKKLGIKGGMAVTLVNAPDAFERSLDPLPDGVLMKYELRGKADLVVLFASRMDDIYEQFPLVDRLLNAGGRLWIAWPKQSSGVKTDVKQPSVREFGLAAGWVDFKICAIDETWSGLAFVRRSAGNERESLGD